MTLYTVHVVALAEPWGEWDSVGYYLIHVVVALTFATVWLWLLPKGPMEWMVHTISSGVGTMLVPPDVPATRPMAVDVRPGAPDLPPPTSPRDHAHIRQGLAHLRMITRGFRR